MMGDDVKKLHRPIWGTPAIPIICASQCRDQDGTVQSWPCATARSLKMQLLYSRTLEESLRNWI